MQNYDDDNPLGRPGLVQLRCPDCLHVVHGRGEAHARDLLAIHREAACQGTGGGDSE